MAYVGDALNVRPGDVVVWATGEHVYIVLRTLTLDGVDLVTVRQDRDKTARMVAALRRWLDDPGSAS